MLTCVMWCAVRKTLRKLSAAELETAYDQTADMAVLHGTNVRAG